MTGGRRDAGLDVAGSAANRWGRGQHAVIDALLAFALLAGSASIAPVSAAGEVGTIHQGAIEPRLTVAKGKPNCFAVPCPPPTNA